MSRQGMREGVSRAEGVSTLSGTHPLTHLWELVASGYWPPCSSRRFCQRCSIRSIIERF